MNASLGVRASLAERLKPLTTHVGGRETGHYAIIHPLCKNVKCKNVKNRA